MQLDLRNKLTEMTLDLSCNDPKAAQLQNLFCGSFMHWLGQSLQAQNRPHEQKVLGVVVDQRRILMM